MSEFEAEERVASLKRELAHAQGRAELVAEAAKAGALAPLELAIILGDQVRADEHGRATVYLEGSDIPSPQSVQELVVSANASRPYLFDTQQEACASNSSVRTSYDSRELKRMSLAERPELSRRVDAGEKIQIT